MSWSLICGERGERWWYVPWICENKEPEDGMKELFTFGVGIAVRGPKEWREKVVSFEVFFEFAQRMFVDFRAWTSFHPLSIFHISLCSPDEGKEEKGGEGRSNRGKERRCWRRVSPSLTIAPKDKGRERWEKWASFFLPLFALTLNSFPSSLYSSFSCSLSLIISFYSSSSYSGGPPPFRERGEKR